MTLRNIFLKMAEEVKRYPNIVQLTNTLNKGFKQVADNINGGGSDVVVTPAYTSGEKLATITVDDVDKDIYMPNGEVKTMEGSSFKTVNGSLVDEMKVGFTPIQNLHGYSKPWVGGTGKNILFTTLSSIKTINTSGTWADNVYTADGVQFEVVVDDSNNVQGIKVNRLSASGSNVVFNVTKGSDLNNLINKSIVLNGAGSDSSVDMYLQFYSYNGTNDIVVPLGSDTTAFTPTSGMTASSAVRIVIRTASNPSDVIFHPMARLSTIADPTFEPYSNICPISGHTQVQSKINNTTYTTSLGSTYYGGDVEQVGGTGNATITYVDLGSLTWEYQSGYKRMRASISGAKLAPDSGSVAPNIMCENYKSVAMTITQTENGTIALGSTGYSYIYVHDEAYNDATVFKSAVSGVKFCYELATPTALTLTGQNITAEPGVNEVSAPGTNQEIMEVKYHQMLTIGDIEKLIE